MTTLTPGQLAEIRGRDRGHEGDISYEAQSVRDRRALLAHVDALRARVGELERLLADCAEHFKTLRGAGVFVWPNHPQNPETRISEALSKEPT